jgi:hypothetical protein
MRENVRIMKDKELFFDDLGFGVEQCRVLVDGSVVNVKIDHASGSGL